MLLKVISVQGISNYKRESQMFKEESKKKGPNTFGKILDNAIKSRNEKI